MPQTQRVIGPGYEFDAPEGWPISRREHVVSTARPGSEVDLLSVSRYVLPRVPTAAEIDAAAQALAKTLHGRVTSTTSVTVAGQRARQFQLSYSHDAAERGLRLTFYLAGKRELQLLCRWESPPGKEISAACDLLVTSFRPR
jgi:hypothetical protein